MSRIFPVFVMVLIVHVHRCLFFPFDQKHSEEPFHKQKSKMCLSQRIIYAMIFLFLCKFLRIVVFRDSCTTFFLFLEVSSVPIVREIEVWLQIIQASLKKYFIFPCVLMNNFFSFKRWIDWKSYNCK